MKVRTNEKGLPLYWHRLLDDDEAVDEVRIAIATRYKQSHLSGDEWRQNYFAEFFYKGHSLGVLTGLKLEDAALQALKVAMAHKLFGEGDWAKDAPYIIDKLRNEYCDQPGCRNEPHHFLVLKKLYSQGEEIVQKDLGWRYFRKFCGKHKTRGDCGMEDADSNYEEVARSEIYEEGE